MDVGDKLQMCNFKKNQPSTDAGNTFTEMSSSNNVNGRLSVNLK